MGRITQSTIGFKVEFPTKVMGRRVHSASQVIRNVIELPNVSIVWKFCVLVNNVNNIKAPATGKDADSSVTESRS